MCDSADRFGRPKLCSSSHVVTIKTKLTDEAAVKAACYRLALHEPTRGTAKLYSSSAEGLIVQLDGWSYPVVVNTASGEISYDNYHGSWGDQARLDQFIQAYAVEKAKIEARRKGHRVSEQTLEDGSIKVLVEIR